eukprot:6454448-Amphidinium_carterae.1
MEAVCKILGHTQVLEQLDDDDKKRDDPDESEREIQQRNKKLEASGLSMSVPTMLGMENIHSTTSVLMSPPTLANLSDSHESHEPCEELDEADARVDRMYWREMSWEELPTWV